MAANSKGPVSDRVVILPIEAPSTIGGLQLPETQAERPRRGIVKAVGPGRVTEQGIRIFPEVEIGDEVLFPDYAGESTLYLLTLEDGVERAYRIVRHDEILFNCGCPPGGPDLP